MTVAAEKPEAQGRDSLPGGRILRQVLWLLVVTIGSGFTYSFFLLASKGAAFGGVDANGGYIDAHGNPTTTAPWQINAVAHASPAIPVLLGAIVLAAIVLVLRVARDEDAALRVLNLSMAVIAAIAACSLVVGYVWFFATPVDY